MLRTSACPDLNLYRQLTPGTLPGEEKDALLAHLGGCDACGRRLAGQPENDSLADLLRQAGVTLAGTAGRPPAPAAADPEARTVPPRDPPPAPASPLVFPCPGCGKRLKVKAALTGKKIKCPHCQTVTPIPATTDADRDEKTHLPADEDEKALGEVSGPQGQRNAGTVDSSAAPRADETQAERGSLPTYDFLAPPQAPDELGRLGPYRVLKALGAGGMGVVFAAEDPHLRRKVALKGMLPAFAAGKSAKERFLREARAAAAIKHDHVVTIYQVAEDRGVPYLAMELLDGEPLDARLVREGKLPVQEVLRIGREIAEGLDAAHEQQMIHRDIKPANVWLEKKKGRVKILDFGLARSVEDQAQLTQSGAIIGTPAYMAPEQAKGSTVDYRCDLFSLGCVLYRMATGANPFKGTDTISTLMAVATEQPVAPARQDREVPRPLSDLIMRLLEKKPEDRPPSARAVADALAALEGQAPTGQRAAPAATGGKRRVALLAAVGTLLLAGLSATATVLLWETPQGTVKLTLEDPNIQVAFKQGSAHITGVNKSEEIVLRPGDYGLHVAWKGVEFDTQQFAVPQGKVVALRVELLPGKVQVVQADRGVIGERVLGPEQQPPGSAGSPATPAPPPPNPDRPLPVLEPRHRLHWPVPGTYGVFALDFSQDSALVLASFGKINSFRIWDTATGQVVTEAPGFMARLTPDKKQAVSVATWHSHFQIHHLPDGKVVRSVGDPKGPLFEFALSRQGTRLANTAPEWVEVFDWAADSRLCRVSARASTDATLFTPDGRYLLRQAEGKPPLEVYDAGTGREADAFHSLREVGRLVHMSADGRRLLTAEGAGLVVYDVATGKTINRFSTGIGARGAFSGDGRELLTTTGAGDSLTVWDVDAARPLAVLRSPEPVGQVLFRLSPDGRTAVIAGPTDAVYLFDLAKKAEGVR